MKKYFIFIAAATALLLTTSCQKDETVQCFTARLEKSSSDAKTILSGTHIYWQNGDEVEIYDASGSHATFTAQPHSTHSGDRTYANLVNSSNTLSASGGYKAIYPASIAKGSNTIELPRVQNSTDGSLTEYPMYAESSNKSLQFYNLCSVLKLNLEKAGESVSKIQIVTDKLTTGTFTIAYNGGNPTLTPTNNYNNHTAVTTLQLGTAQSIDNAKDFYIYLPAFDYSYMQIKVYNAQGLLFFETWQKTDDDDFMTLVRSRYHTITFGENDLEFHNGNVNGLFHIGPNTVVTFAKGNLLQSNSDNTYKFADEQYNYKEDGYTYRFTWGTTTGEFNEPGNNDIENATGTWRTMTANEWKYVCNNAGRSSEEDGDRHAYVSPYYNHTRTHIKVTKSGGGTIGGLILFPDQFHWPLDASKEPSRFEANASGYWNNTTLTYEDWKVLEEAGCVFLPMTHGYIKSVMGGGVLPDTEGNTPNGCYWTSSWNASSSKGRYVNITRTQMLWPADGSEAYPDARMSHRLVRVVSQ